MDRSAARLIQRARTATPPPRALSLAEQARLVAALDQAVTWPERRDRALFRFLLGTGVRLSTALALRVDDLDLDEGVVDLRVGKGEVRSRLPLAPCVVTLLADWIGEKGPAFPSRSTRPLSPRQAQARFRAWCRKAEIQRTASPHSLRHSCAMNLLSRTGNLAVVQRLLGHRAISSTQVYARADDAALRAALT